VSTPPYPPELRLDLFLTAWVARQEGDFATVRDVLAAAPPAMLHNDVELGVMLSQAYAQLGQTQEARAVVERIRPLVGPRTPGLVRLNFTAVDGAVLLLEGRLREWAAVSAQQLSLAMDYGTDEGRIGASLNVGGCAALLWELPRAIQTWQRGLDEARHRGVTALLPWLHHNLARAYRHANMLAESQRHLEASVEYARPEWMMAHWEQEKAALLVEMGDPLLAGMFAARALAGFQAVSSAAGECETRLVLIRIAVVRGDLAQAREEVALATAVLPEHNLYLLAQVSEEAAVVHLLRGDRAASDAAAARARKAYAEMGAPRQVRRLLRRLRHVAREGTAPGIDPAPALDGGEERPRR
jgi:tetratricopeptide (TPR) repeat protein